MQSKGLVLIFALSLTTCFALAQDTAEANLLVVNEVEEEEALLRESLKQHFASLEDYIGITQQRLQELLGEPARTAVVARGVLEHEAVLWYYDFRIAESNLVHWRVALQNKRVVGIQIATTEHPAATYAAAIDFLKEGGSTVGHAAGHENRKVARRGDMIWQVDRVQHVFGDAAVLEVGTVKYSTCELVWDLEKLRGTDGFGRPLDESRQ